jgi:hypothetical protein
MPGSYEALIFGDGEDHLEVLAHLFGRYTPRKIAERLAQDRANPIILVGKKRQ